MWDIYTNIYIMIISKQYTSINRYDDYCVQGKLFLIKVVQYQKERKLFDEIWIKMKNFGKLPQIFIVIWKANLVFYFVEEWNINLAIF